MSTKKTAKKSSAKTTKAKTPAAAKKSSSTKASSSAKTSKTAKTAKTGKVAKVAKTSKAAPAPAKPAPELDPQAKAIVLSARKRTTTPALFKPRKSKNTPIMFTMEDVAEILEKRKDSAAETQSPANSTTTVKKSVKTDVNEPAEPVHRNHAPASLADILGFNPAEKKKMRDETDVPKKWLKNYKILLELRDHVSTGLAIHSADTLKRSSKDDSGDLSGYGQHMADAGTDTFDRDFALSLVSTEQEALYEIEEAIQRIFDGSYGTCEITNEPIDKERLLAVPFTRYSLEGQRELERNRRRKQQRIGVFADGDDAISLGDDDDGDS